jgi:4-hydroxy-3-polyprenylbenzoate decarboxylase
MSYRDLPEYLGYLDKRGVLRHIEIAVDSSLEIATIAARSNNLLEGGPALHFQNVNGATMPVLVNLFSNIQRAAWALGLTNLDQLELLYREILQLKLSGSSIDKLVQLGANADLLRFATRPTKSGPCQEIIYNQNPSFDLLPILQHNTATKRVLASAQLIYKEPQTAKTRLTLIDLHIADQKNYGLVTPHPFTAHIPLFKEEFELTKNNKVPAAIVIGDDPVLTMAAVVPLPAFLDELTLAGFLRRGRLDTVKCLTHDLEVPANAEIVLEGYLIPTTTAKVLTTRTGFQYNMQSKWVFELTAITQRQQAIFVTATLATSNQEKGLLKVIERTLLAMLQQSITEIVDLALPAAGTFYNLALVSIKKHYAGHARQVMSALWGSSWLSQVKTLVVVDADCSLQDYEQVLGRVTANLNPNHDLTQLNGVLSGFDHTGFGQFGGKLGIDATRKLGGESMSVNDSSAVATLDQKACELVDQKWPSYGID